MAVGVANGFSIPCMNIPASIKRIETGVAVGAAGAMESMYEYPRLY